MGIDTKIRFKLPYFTPTPNENKAFYIVVSVKKGFYRLNKPKPLKIFSLDRLLWLFLKL